ncbi:hypothetical protein NSE_0355 [Neorickettsia sennetsu str. Miyayama]|uniref:Uncharacterized protein n=1 Tax=Ehrlichia sennetsu (strain ATCC VR-367 / Miyayama) TaxID=222891 RepID=Q2GE52_EHRS3|nr:hypothetical protein NSE_0355 [Neorickettsia sennetsu str. Miyayama]
MLNADGLFLVGALVLLFAAEDHLIFISLLTPT